MNIVSWTAVVALLLMLPVVAQTNSGGGLPPLPPISAPNLAQTQPGAPTPAPGAAIPVSDFQKYKTKFKEAVASRWYLKINRQNILLSQGTIHVTYTIQADGTVTSAKVKGAKAATMLLKTISVEAIQQTSPFLPFSAALREQVGDHYSATLTFTIDSKDLGTVKSS